MARKRKAAKPKAKAEDVGAELEPFKIVGQLVGARRNPAGEVVAEEVMGQVQIYRPNFGLVEQLIDEAMREARVEGGD